MSHSDLPLASEKMNSQKNKILNSEGLLKLDLPVLVVEPHPDDGLIGCFSFLRAMSVTSLFLTPRSNYLRLKEGIRLSSFLGNETLEMRIKDGKVRHEKEKVRDYVNYIIEEKNIKIVLIPAEEETHMDHRATFHSLSGLGGVTVIGYSVWNTIKRPDFSCICKLEEKVELFKKFYMTQLADPNILELIIERNKIETFTLINGDGLWEKQRAQLFGFL